MQQLLLNGEWGYYLFSSVALTQRHYRFGDNVVFGLLCDMVWKSFEVYLLFVS